VFLLMAGAGQSRVETARFPERLWLSLTDGTGDHRETGFLTPPTLPERGARGNRIPAGCDRRLVYVSRET